MLMLRNDKISLYCRPNGDDLVILDLQRGTRWTQDPETIVYAVKNGAGKLERLPMKPVRAEMEDQALRVVYEAHESHVEYVYRLHANYIELEAAGDNLPKQIQGFSMPGSFIPNGERLWLVLPIMQGMLWKGKGEAFEWHLPEGNHGGCSMPLVGYLGATGGLLVTEETRDDFQLWVGKDDRNRCWANFLQIGSLGIMRYKRIARIYLMEPSYVSIAKTYRRKVMEQGRFKSWEEKIAQRPALERLFGALMCFIGYCQDELDYAAECEKLKRYGFDKALVYPARFNTYKRKDIRMGGLPAIDLSQEQVAGIKALGYDVAPWNWVNEAIDDGSDAIRARYRKSADGQYIPSWRIDDQQWNQICTTFMAEYQGKANAGAFSDMTWDHFDVIAAATLGECHALDHPAHLGRPLSRTEDRKFIHELLQIGHAYNRPISSEVFNDAYSTSYDIGSVKALPMFNHWPFWPIPLTMLVYHDSMIHSWWEVHNYNAHYFGHVRAHKFYENGGGRPRLQAAMDALYGCPPDVFPFGSQYMWTGRGNETFAYKFRFEDPEVQYALRMALPVAKLHEKIGKLEMLEHRFLSEDGNVQETIFSNGTRVVANFAGDLRGDIPGSDPLHAESWIATDT